MPLKERHLDYQETMKNIFSQNGGKAHDILTSVFTIPLVFAYALSMNMFIVPSGIYSGGIMGISQLIRTILVRYAHVSAGFDFASIIYYAINVPIFIYAWGKMKHKTLIKTIVTVSFMSLFLAIIPVRALLPDDRLASVIVGSLICGTSTGLILRCGSSEGGLDIVGLLMAMSKRNMSVGEVSIIVNAVQFVAYALLFGVQVVIYSMIYTFLNASAVDRFHLQNINVEVKIVTHRKKELADALMKGLNRGVTEWSSVGAYTESPSEVLYVIISKYEITRLRNIIRQYDPEAFVVIVDKVHVYGNYLKRL